jgi:uncharacterized protein (DUF488 family)
VCVYAYAFEHETRDLTAAYQVVVKLVVKLVVDVRGGDVVQAAVEHETRDIYLYNIHTHTYIYIYVCVYMHTRLSMRPEISRQPTR